MLQPALSKFKGHISRKGIVRHSCESISSRDHRHQRTPAALEPDVPERAQEQGERAATLGESELGLEPVTSRCGQAESEVKGFVEGLQMTLDCEWVGKTSKFV